jgi:hypothetical protein
MDTALFYPSHLHLSAAAAWTRVSDIIHKTVRFGGCVTVNWHDRSVAPERQWGDFYTRMIGYMADQGAWFATASDAVAWFRYRRSARFEYRRSIPGVVHVDVPNPAPGVPELRLRVHHGAASHRDVPLPADGALFQAACAHSSPACSTLL